MSRSQYTVLPFDPTPPAGRSTERSVEGLLVKALNVSRHHHVHEHPPNKSAAACSTRPLVRLKRARQVDDLLGMQACNLQNLPENYTMRYCTIFSSAGSG
jgi:hypothetical protein